MAQNTGIRYTGIAIPNLHASRKKNTIHLQRTIISPGFESSPNGTTGLGSNPGRSIGSSWEMYSVCTAWDTLNSLRVASHLQRLEEADERWEASNYPKTGVKNQNWRETEPNYTVTCMVLKAAANDRRTFRLLA
ncbi:hypothetical protein TNCV_217911 [Trichonephila clavipes]|nr:hypothetical protein TNCV_217911 [Trichonephila clavipes]